MVNGKWTSPPKLELARKDMKFGIIEKDFLSFLEIFAGHHLVMPPLGLVFGNL